MPLYKPELFRGLAKHRAHNENTLLLLTEGRKPQFVFYSNVNGRSRVLKYFEKFLLLLRQGRKYSLYLTQISTANPGLKYFLYLKSR